MTTNVLLIYPRPSISSPQKSAPLSILHVGEALRRAKARGKSDEDYSVRYFDERYDDPPDLAWADVVGVSSMTGYQLKGAIHWLKAAKAAGVSRGPLKWTSWIGVSGKAKRSEYNQKYIS